MKRLGLMSFLLVISSYLALEASAKVSQSFAKLITSQDQVARYLEYLFIEQGQVIPPPVYPMSWQELRYYLTESLDKSQLSAMGRQVYETLWVLSEQENSWGVGDWVAFRPLLQLDLQVYMLPERLTRQWYFQYYERRPALLNMGLEFSLFNCFYLQLDIKLRPDRLYQAKISNTHWTNCLSSDSGLDTQFPQRAFGSFAKEHLNIQGGRNLLNWGNGKSGNLLLSEAPEELNYLQISTWWKLIKFTSLWVFLDNPLPQLLDPSKPELGYKTHKVNDKTFFYAQTPDKVLPSHYFLAHRLDFKMGERMYLSLTEAVVYRDYWNNLAFLNPFYVFHNWYLTGHGDYFLSIDVQIELTRNWTIYAQLLLDQVAAGFNRLSPETMAYPGSLPILVGSQFTYPLKAGYINWTTEFVKIDPYAYLDRSTVGLWMNKTWLTSAGSYAVHLIERVPLGYYLGNDLLRAWTKLTWDCPFFYSVWLELSALWKGENTLLSPWSMATGEALKLAPSGKVKSQYAIGVGGDLNLARWLSGNKLSFETSLAYLLSHFLGKWSWDVQYSFGMHWEY